MQQIHLETKNLSFTYPDGTEALKNVNIHIHCGELTVIIGKNGAGKSTLLKAILGEIPHTGEITFLDMKENSKKKIKGTDIELLLEESGLFEEK